MPAAPPPSRATVGSTEPEPGSAEILTYVGFSVAGLGLVTGTITGAVSISQTQTLKDDCPNDECTPDKQDEIDTMLALAHVSTVSFIVAGVGTAVGLFALLASGSDESTEGAAIVQPIVGPGLLGLRGQF